MTTATLPETNHAEWLAKRRKGIGASEAAGVLNLSPYTTALQIYARKLGIEPEQEENVAMRRGKRREAIIIDDYIDSEGIDRGDVFGEQKFCAHPKYPWMLATLDAVRSIDGHLIPVEIKHVGRQSARYWGTEGDAVPPMYLCQVHQQIAVTGAPYAHLAAEIAGDYALFTIERDDAFIDLLTTIEAEFWSRVIRKDPPPASSVADIRVLARLNPSPEGEIEIDEALADQSRRYEDLGEQYRAIEKQRDDLKFRIIEALGNSKVGRSISGVKAAKAIVSMPARSCKNCGFEVSKASVQTRLTVTLPRD